MITFLSQNGIKACRGQSSIYRLRQASTKSSVRDYYQILGLQRDATQRQIKAAYYELSKKYHPDVAGKSADAEAKFIEITEAYECLKDPQKRKVYDSEGAGGRPHNDFWEYSRRRPEDPFRKRQFTREEYEQVWEEFNRMRTERESYDARVRRETEKLFEEFIRERAARWQNFHTKYPNEPPESFRYTWRWTSHNPTAKRNLALFTRIVVIYMVCFTMVTLYQILLEPLFPVETTPKSSMQHDMQVQEPEGIRRSTQFQYMNNPPSVNSDGWSNVVNNAYPSNEMVDFDPAPGNSVATSTRHSV